MKFLLERAYLVCSVVKGRINLVVHVVLTKQEEDTGEEQRSTVIEKL